MTLDKYDLDDASKKLLENYQFGIDEKGNVRPQADNELVLHQKVPQPNPEPKSNVSVQVIYQDKDGKELGRETLQVSVGSTLTSANMHKPANVDYADDFTSYTVVEGENKIIRVVKIAKVKSSSTNTSTNLKVSATPLKKKQTALPRTGENSTSSLSLLIGELMMFSGITLLGFRKKFKNRD